MTTHSTFPVSLVINFLHTLLNNISLAFNVIYGTFQSNQGPRYGIHLFMHFLLFFLSHIIVSFSEILEIVFTLNDSLTDVSDGILQLNLNLVLVLLDHSLKRVQLDFGIN